MLPSLEVELSIISDYVDLPRVSPTPANMSYLLRAPRRCLIASWWLSSDKQLVVHAPCVTSDRLVHALDKDSFRPPLALKRRAWTE